MVAIFVYNSLHGSASPSKPIPRSAWWSCTAAIKSCMFSNFFLLAGWLGKFPSGSSKQAIHSLAFQKGADIRAGCAVSSIYNYFEWMPKWTPEVWRGASNTDMCLSSPLPVSKSRAWMSFKHPEVGSTNGMCVLAHNFTPVVFLGLWLAVMATPPSKP